MDLIWDHLLLSVSGHGFRGARRGPTPHCPPDAGGGRGRAERRLPATPSHAVSQQQRPTLPPGNSIPDYSLPSTPSWPRIPPAPSPLPELYFLPCFLPKPQARRLTFPSLSRSSLVPRTAPAYLQERTLVPEQTREVMDLIGPRLGQSFPKKDLVRSQKPLPF